MSRYVNVRTFSKQKEYQGSSSDTLSVDPALTLSVARNSGGSAIPQAAFDRYRGIVFKNIAGVGFSFIRKLREQLVSSVSAFDIDTLKITQSIQTTRSFSLEWMKAIPCWFPKPRNLPKSLLR
ncbi:hypothetical protein glysoja_023734 [Glycine soja]|nr:hypothetical protein glysoja_023734 [Glycine soja]